MKMPIDPDNPPTGQSSGPVYGALTALQNAQQAVALILRGAGAGMPYQRKLAEGIQKGIDAISKADPVTGVAPIDQLVMDKL